MLTATINGGTHASPPGASILQALVARGVHLPTLCHDDRLAPSAACRLCLVQISGWPRPVPACATPLLDGMRIETHTTDLEDNRRWLLRMLARRYPAQAVSRFPEKPFHRALVAYGLTGELVVPYRPHALPTEFSRIQIRAHGRKVFDIRWDSEKNFSVVTYEPGDWERTLLDWPAPVPFD